MYNQELSGTPGGGGVNGGAAGGGGGTYGGRGGGGSFDSNLGGSLSGPGGGARAAMGMAGGLNGMMSAMDLGSMGISPGTGMCPKSEDSENSPIGPAPRGRPGPGGDGGEGGGPGPGPGVGPGGGRGPRGGGRPPGWAWGAHDIDPETGKLIAPMEPMPTVRYMGDPASDAIFALNASWGHGRGTGRNWWEYGHEFLDALGLIPVFGEVFDLANGIWYAFEGEWGYAGISFIAMAPVIGDVGKGAKYAYKAADFYRNVKGKVKAANFPDHVPASWSHETMEEVAEELAGSILKRKDELRRLGDEPGHRRRIGQEEDFLRKILKQLLGS